MLTTALPMVTVHCSYVGSKSTRNIAHCDRRCRSPPPSWKSWVTQDSKTGKKLFLAKGLRHSFLQSVEPLDGSARTRRLTLWSSHLQTTSHKLSFSPKESLPPGSSETWPNRLRTGTGRCKSLMQKWGFNEDGQTTCECGNEQTMKHLLVCPILPQPCTHEDLEEFNPRARSCAQHWAGVV